MSVPAFHNLPTMFKNYCENIDFLIEYKKKKVEKLNEYIIHIPIKDKEMRGRYEGYRNDNQLDLDYLYRKKNDIVESFHIDILLMRSASLK